MERSASPRPSYRRCRCGRAFMPDPDKEITCSKRCAHQDALLALQGGDSAYRQRQQLQYSQSHQLALSQASPSRAPRLAELSEAVVQAPGEPDAPPLLPKTVITTPINFTFNEDGSFEHVDTFVNGSDVEQEDCIDLMESAATEEDNIEQFAVVHDGITSIKHGKLPEITITPPSATSSTTDFMSINSSLQADLIKLRKLKAEFLGQTEESPVTMKPQLVRFPATPSQDLIFVPAPPLRRAARRTNYPPYGAAP